MGSKKKPIDYPVLKKNGRTKCLGCNDGKVYSRGGWRACKACDGEGWIYA